jgi:PAS domain S-box-containing protein
MERAPVRILLIEDNRGDARLLEQLLREADGLRWELDWADSLEDGIARLQEGGVDLVMLDLDLPGSSGIETVLRVRCCGAQLPALIVLSGLNDESVALRAVQAGAEDYLVKGEVDARLLARAIRYALERSQSKAALRHAHDMLEARVVERTAELRKSEQEFRTLAENAPDMVIRYDTECRRIYVNPAFERETGIAAADALYLEPEKMAHLQSNVQLEDYKQILRQVMASGTGTEVFARNMNKSGGPRDYAFHLVPERDASGRVVGVLAIGRNITALKESERRLSESQQQLRQLATRSEAVREEERKYLTREIHDELGQYLSALRLGVSVLEMQFGSGNPALAERTRALTGLVDSTIQVVRNIVGRLRPGALDMGIVSALEWLVEQFRSNNDVACQLHVDESRIRLDEVRAIELFRIVQESLTNVRRHANATRVDIALLSDGEHYVLEVRDNGCGFDPGQAKRQSFGLVGIRERALKLDGTADIDSKPGRGTRLRVKFPVISAA